MLDGRAVLGQTTLSAPRRPLAVGTTTDDDAPAVTPDSRASATGVGHCILSPGNQGTSRHWTTAAHQAPAALKPIRKETCSLIDRASAPLSERIVGYPTTAPQTMAELVNTDKGFLKHLEGATEEEIATVISFRREILDALLSLDAIAITSPEAALRALVYRHIRTTARRWMVLALNKERKRVLVPKAHDPGAQGYALCVSQAVPTPARLARELPLPEGGTYLVIYGQSPSVLAETGVADAVARLLANAPVADVLFWHLQRGIPPTLYSLRKGQGDCGGTAVAFPDPEAVARAKRPALSRAATAPSPVTARPRQPTGNQQ